MTEFEGVVEKYKGYEIRELKLEWGSMYYAYNPNTKLNRFIKMTIQKVKDDIDGNNE